MPHRAALSGILFVLRSGIPWEMLPQQMGRGSGVTCWRRLRDWQKAGVWDRLHRELLRRLREADRIDWGRACMDSASIAAKREGARRGRTRRTKARSCPIAWCRSDGSRRVGLPGQAGTADSLAGPVSLTVLMPSRVM